MGPLRFELKSLAPQALSYGEKQSINVAENTFKQYMDILEINGISDGWRYSVNRCILRPYFTKLHWHITFRDTLEYLKIQKQKHSLSYYRKEVYQIRKFLEYLGIEWANKLNPPPEPEYIPKRITSDTITEALSYYQNNEYYKKSPRIPLILTSG